MTEPSGVQWCVRYPGSKSVSDLAIPFRGDVQNLLQRCLEGKASVDVTATRRPKERAWLMHYSCWVAGFTMNGLFHRIEPTQVPAAAGIDIDWTHGGNSQAARAAAQAMKAAYGIVYPAALTSRHIDGLAIDWKIHIPAGAVILSATGATFLFAEETDQTNGRFWALARTYGVLALPEDPVHFSIDGH